MKNQFTYTREETVVNIKASEDEASKTIIRRYIDSFNMERVIRSISLEDGRLLILLDDLHQRTTNVPILNKKNQVTGTKKETNTYQSEIYMEGEDTERYRKLTSFS